MPVVSVTWRLRLENHVSAGIHIVIWGVCQRDRDTGRKREREI